MKRENLIPIIKKCVEDLIFQAEKRKIFINLELPTDLNVDIDKELIKKAILNLLSNAVKNTLPNGDIYVKSIEHQNFIDIIIRDTGVGLTDKEIPILFKKFGKIERYGKGMDVDIEGPGLGLYIANEIVKLHIGEILVKSKGRNKGSTFILRLFLK
ncbi:MAG TPA: HAMP domain-containing histidine kinase [bacterium]|nr:HAMP domain-containing histidine kinase [bacterium]